MDLRNKYLVAARPRWALRGFFHVFGFTTKDTKSTKKP